MEKPWRWEGRLGRGAYLGWGLGLLALKYNLDRLVAALAFGRSWSPLNYLEPESGLSQQGTTTLGLSNDQLDLYLSLVALALPFVWMGVALTLRRLKDVGLPAALVGLFFVPLINLLMFLALVLLPSQGEEDTQGRLPPLGRWIPASALGSALLGVAITLPVGLGLIVLAIHGFGQYGWGLFVGLPFLMGLTSTVVYGHHQPRSYAACLGVATLSVASMAALLLAVAIEGVICIGMAAPLGWVLAAMGATLGHFLQRARHPKALPSALALLCVVQPALMGFEAAGLREPPIAPLRTAVEVDAPPAVVWRHVVSFAELPPPDDFLFRVGVAYPMRARIQGSGVGAVRRCEFSTGPFVEPITVWEPPRLLKFDVTSQPPAMRELNPLTQIQAPHLDQYMKSHGGQFLLTALPGGRTRLEGTTWYTHALWPQAYWQVWTDGILHAIHHRVLRHVKALAEADAAGRATGPAAAQASR